MTKFKALVLLTTAFLSASAQAGFGAVQVFDNARVGRIYSGSAQTFVTFTALPGCFGSGGYLTVSWAFANGGSTNEDRTKQLVAVLLFAKATDALFEVRYRLNDAPTGWDSCTIDAIYLH